MVKWEYREVRVTATERRERLNGLGQAGWECCAIIPIDSYHLKGLEDLVLKRPIKEEEQYGQ